MNGPPMVYNNGSETHFNQWGLRDKVDQATGLTQVNPLGPQFNTLEYMITVDTRDCIGTRSLDDARAIAVARGEYPAVQGSVTDITPGYPTVITLSRTDTLQDNQNMLFQGINGDKMTRLNGVKQILNVNHGTNTVEVMLNTTGGTYTGGGIWTRPQSLNYPTVQPTDSVIVGNKIKVYLEKELKMIRSISMFHCVIPRDLIPLYIYLYDFIPASTDENNTVYPAITETNYTTYIPQEAWYMQERILGFYSTPLDMWRSYSYGAFSMQDQYTPPPLQLWNPPIGDWPNQPIPYPYQTVPTYRSGNFSINLPKPIPGDFYLILSGYGVYDLHDWSVPNPNSATGNFQTNLVRKLLLFLITPRQSLKNVDYIDLILNCQTTTLGAGFTTGYGFGQFQRYVPGPGVGQSYQPGTSTTLVTGPPNVPGSDHPIAFPNFRGNVWGPYNSPGDRFQKIGLRSIVQDLFLNGDLNNLLGSPIIVPSVPTEALIQDQSFGLNFSSMIECNLGNIQESTNPNIMNAMRIVSNGFGAANFRANGGGTFYTSRYNNTAGGQGPTPLGVAGGAWVNTGIYGAASYSDPVAQGPAGPNMSVATSDASHPGTSTPTSATGFYDLGPNNGNFQFQIGRFIAYVVNDIPDNDVIVRVEEALREERAQSTRPLNSDCILDCPIRLNLGSTSGTQQYVEALQALLANGVTYWDKRYLTPESSIKYMNISFSTYGGEPIPLEKMLQARGALEFLQVFVRVNAVLNVDFETNPFSFTFLFDPMNPHLIGRMKRYIQLIFKAYLYHGLPPGMEPNKVTPIPPGPTGASIQSDVPQYR